MQRGVRLVGGRSLLTRPAAGRTRVQASKEAVAARGAFTVALSGGSLVKALAGLVGRADVDFSKW